MGRLTGKLIFGYHNFAWTREWEKLLGERSPLWNSGSPVLWAGVKSVVSGSGTTDHR